MRPLEVIRPASGSRVAGFCGMHVRRRSKQLPHTSASSDGQRHLIFRCLPVNSQRQAAIDPCGEKEAYIRRNYAPLYGRVVRFCGPLPPLQRLAIDDTTIGITVIYLSHRRGGNETAVRRVRIGDPDFRLHQCIRVHSASSDTVVLQVEGTSKVWSVTETAASAETWPSALCSGPSEVRAFWGPNIT